MKTDLASPIYCFYTVRIYCFTEWPSFLDFYVPVTNVVNLCINLDTFYLLILLLFYLSLILCLTTHMFLLLSVIIMDIFDISFFLYLIINNFLSIVCQTNRFMLHD